MGVYSLDDNRYSSINIDDIINDDSINENQFDDEDISTQIFIQTETNWYKLMSEVGISELYSIENDSAVLYESIYTDSQLKYAEYIQRQNDATIRFTSIVDEKIRIFIKKIAMKSDKSAKEDKKFLSKYKKEISNINIPSNFSYKGYNYTHLDEKPKDLVKIFRVSPDDDLNNINVESICNDIRAKIIKTNKPITSSMWKKELTKYFRDNKQEPQVIKNININDLVNIIKDRGNVKSKLAVFSKQIKTDLDTLVYYNNNLSNSIGNLAVKDKSIDEIRSYKLSIEINTAIARKIVFLSMSYFEEAMKAVDERADKAKEILLKLMNKSFKNESFEDSEYYASLVDNVEFI